MCNARVPGRLMCLGEGWLNVGSVSYGGGGGGGSSMGYPPTHPKNFGNYSATLLLKHRLFLSPSQTRNSF